MMLRQAARALRSSSVIRHADALSAGASASLGGRRHYADYPAELKAAFQKVAPTLDPPTLQSSFMKERPPVPATIPEKVTFNFVLPHAIVMKEKQVDQVILPATSGQMGVLPGHVATIAELKPGLLSVFEGTAETKYFVSSGFAFIHANSVVDLCGVEAVELANLDPEEVRKGLAAYQAKAGSANTELEKAEAQIGVDVHSAMAAALSL
eukprot:TRINITY_DN29654_c0_g1_i1.p1 TRINITY_DN29654_c0_g1~~TRINITY_DN29654_c0_g1_i1.p1  ORF type:complete len:209 (-),score=48.20 TRINITY_DN29654_c0_g1_i1:1266-1892(-)